MRKTIWQEKNDPFAYEKAVETSAPDYRHKFVEALAEYVVEALRVPWDDHKTVKGLLISAIGEDVRDLLRQYLHNQLEVIGASINWAFGTEAEVETGYATHAKMDQFVEAIKEMPFEKEGGWDDLFLGHARFEEVACTFVLDPLGETNGYYWIRRRRDGPAIGQAVEALAEIEAMAP